MPVLPRIVVGIDDSDASAAALRWAAAQAKALHAQIVAVHAWEPAARQLAPYAPVPAHPTVREERLHAEQLLHNAVRGVLGDPSPAPLRTVAAEGAAVPVLLEQAHGAVLLALGRRPPDGTAVSAVGAVGRGCLSAAVVPVVSIPTDVSGDRLTGTRAHAVLPVG
jgi:nucleotide-binding universal stress UspA family protein